MTLLYQGDRVLLLGGENQHDRSGVVQSAMRATRSLEEGVWAVFGKDLFILHSHVLELISRKSRKKRKARKSKRP